MGGEADNSREESGKSRLRTAIYCRLANKYDESSRECLLKQKEQLLKICKEKNYYVAGIHEDMCSSYPHNMGENYQTVLSMIKSGEVDVLLVAEMSQISRNINDVIDLYKLADEHGVKVIDRNGDDIMEMFKRPLFERKR